MATQTLNFDKLRLWNTIMIMRTALFEEYEKLPEAERSNFECSATANIDKTTTLTFCLSHDGGIDITVKQTDSRTWLDRCIYNRQFPSDVDVLDMIVVITELRQLNINKN